MMRFQSSPIKVLTILIVATTIMLGAFTCGKKDAGEIRIGAIVPLTGDNSVYGIDIRNGMEIAVEEVNTSGELGKAILAIVYEDDQADPQKTVSAYRKLVKVDKVPLILGGVFSASTLAITSLAEKDKIVLLSPTSSAVEITEAGDFVFRIYPSDSYDGLFLADVAKNQLGAQTAVVMFLQVASTVAISDVFQSRFEQLGGEILLAEGHQEGDTDFRATLRKVKQLKPDVVFLPSYLREMAVLLKQDRELGIRTQFLSVSSFYDPKLLELAGNAAEGVIFSAPYYNPQSNDPLVTEFVNQHAKRFGKEPSIWAGYGYDVVRVAAQGLKGEKTPEAIKRALYSIADYPGVTGSITFDSNGDVIKQLELFSVLEGSFAKYH